VSDRLPPDSIARTILEPRELIGAREVPARALAASSIARVVLGAVRAPSAHHRFAIGAVVALLAHAGAAAFAVGLPAASLLPPPERDLAPVELYVELEPAQPQPEPEPLAPEPESEAPAPEPAPASEPAPEPARAPEAAPPKPAASSDPPPPAAAKAASVVASASDDPVDFTGFDVVTGDAEAFAGGATRADGTSDEAVRSPVVGPPGSTTDGTGDADVDRSAPVSLPAKQWSCPWPKEADDLGVDRQEVLIRVVVDERGRVVDVDVLADPGFGFGQATLECAKTERFEPARDAQGVPYAATSGPLRVKFRR